MEAGYFLIWNRQTGVYNPCLGATACKQAVSVHFLPAGVYMLSVSSSTCCEEQIACPTGRFTCLEASGGMHPIRVSHLPNPKP